MGGGNHIPEVYWPYIYAHMGIKQKESPYQWIMRVIGNAYKFIQKILQTPQSQK